MTYNQDIDGTSLQGYVEATFLTLVQAFGLPNSDGDGYKVDAEWIVRTPSGVATIYNYKDGKNYCGEEGLAVKDITDWHIGGHSKAVVSHIQARVKEVQP
jgi:hypothetical protein